MAEQCADLPPRVQAALHSFGVAQADLVRQCHDEPGLRLGLAIIENPPTAAEMSAFLSAGVPMIENIVISHVELEWAVLAALAQGIEQRAADVSLVQLCEQLSSARSIREMKQWADWHPRAARNAAQYGWKDQLVALLTPLGDAMRAFPPAETGLGEGSREAEGAHRERWSQWLAARFAQALQVASSEGAAKMLVLLYVHERRNASADSPDLVSLPPALTLPAATQMFSAASLRVRQRRSAPSGDMAPARTARGMVDAPTLPGFLGTSAASRRLNALVAARMAREVDHRGLRDIARGLISFCEYVHRRLSEDLTRAVNIDGVTIDSNQVYFNRFKFFAPVRDAQDGTYGNERHGLQMSQTLTELAMSIIENAQDAPSESRPDYGLYTRNEGMGRYFPEEEIKGLDIGDVLATIHNADYLQSYREAVRDLWAREGPRGVDVRNEIAARMGRMAESEALQQYEAGQLSADGLRLAQVVLRDRDAQSRAHSDAETVGIVTYELECVASDGNVFAPAGAFVVAAPPNDEVSRGGRCLLYLSGSPTPFTEYSTFAELCDKIRPSGDDNVYQSLIGRLPLQAQNARAPSFQVRAVAEDIVAVTADGVLQTIDDDIEFGITRHSNPDRTGAWLQWLTGASGRTLARALARTATSEVAGGPGWLPPSQRLQVPDAIVNQLAELIEVRGGISAGMPNLPRDIFRHVRGLLKDKFHLAVNPDTTWFHVFRRIPPDASTDGRGLEQPGIIPRDQLESSMTLTEFATRQITGTPIALDPVKERCGIYSQGPEAASFSAANELALRPLDLQSAINIPAFRRHFFAGIDTFWRKHTDDIRKVLEGTFMVDTFLMRMNADLSDAGVALARQLARRNDSRPLTLQGLFDKHARPVAGVAISWLTLGEHASDMALITGTGTGCMLLYGPLSNPATLREFADRGELYAWVTEQAANATRRHVLTGAFAKAQLAETGRASVNGVIDGLSDGSLYAANVVKAGSPVTGDIFKAMTDRLKANLDARALDVRSAEASGSMIAHALDALRIVNDIVGLASWAAPRLLPVSIALSGIELSLGLMCTDAPDTDVSERGTMAVIDASIVGGVSLAGIVASKYVRWRRFNARHLRPYESTVPASEMELVSPNVYHHQGHLFAETETALYGIEYDPAVRTWHMADPEGVLPRGLPVRQNGLFKWEVRGDHETVRPIVEGMLAAPDRDIYDRIIDTEYRRRLLAMERSEDAAVRDAFRAGVEQTGPSWQLPALSSDALKLNFVSRHIDDPRLLGTLHRRLEEVRRTEAIAAAHRVGTLVERDVVARGGTFNAMAQAIRIGAQDMRDTGFGPSLCSVMAVALHQGQEVPLMARVANAVALPAGRDAVAFRRQLTELRAGVGVERARKSSAMTLDLTQVKWLLRTGLRSAAYLLSTRSHSLLVGVQYRADGTVLPYFYDANFGLARFTALDPWEEALGQHLGSRLGDAYEPYGVPARPTFAITPIDLERMAAMRVGPGTVSEMMQVAADEV
ncbi:hypothetical protein GCM10027419_43960 [Pandoraea terrae]